MKPLNDNVVILPKKEEAEEKTAGGIILAGGKKPFTYGTIVFASDEASKVVNIGDTVVFPTGNGLPITHNSEVMLVMSYRNVTAIV